MAWDRCVIGLGMMTRYTMGVYGISLVLATLTPTRKSLRSPWLWAGAVLALMIFLPNLIWQIQNDFISLEFQQVIHERDVQIGRADGYLSEQLLLPNPFILPFWITGLVFFLREAKYRILFFMYLFPVTIFLILQGRGYYPAPTYVMLVAAGMTVFDRWLGTLNPKPALLYRTLGWVAISVGLVVAGALALPIAPINSGLWNVSYDIHDNFPEEIGWLDLNKHVAEVYASLPNEEQDRAGILAGKYGEAGAFHLYGAEYNLPQIISPANSFWMQGPPDESIDLVMTVGYSKETAEGLFISCEVAGQVTNMYNVINQESKFNSILLCKGLRQPWSEMWLTMRRFM